MRIFLCSGWKRNNLEQRLLVSYTLRCEVKIPSAAYCVLKFSLLYCRTASETDSSDLSSDQLQVYVYSRQSSRCGY